MPDAARNLEAARSAADSINAELGSDLVDYKFLDLAALDSVADFVERWGNRPVSILINNAGVMACPLGHTKEGFETQFGTNHLAHFLLTVRLVPALEKGAPSRVISVSSAAHKMSDIDFDDPNFVERDYHPFQAYGQSKTANALFAVEFDRRYSQSGIRAFSVMPGVIRTALSRHMTPKLRQDLGFAQKDASAATDIAYKSVEAGAATSVWAAIATELEGYGGLYLEDCGVALPHGPDSRRGTGVAPHALDVSSAKRLWSLSERLVGLA